MRTERFGRTHATRGGIGGYRRLVLPRGRSVVVLRRRRRRPDRVVVAFFAALSCVQVLTAWGVGAVRVVLTAVLRAIDDGHTVPPELLRWLRDALAPTPLEGDLAVMLTRIMGVLTENGRPAGER